MSNGDKVALSLGHGFGHVWVIRRRGYGEVAGTG
jgi:hypothetical protein